MEEAIVDIRNLVLRFGDDRVSDPLSMRARTGSRIGISGPSGCGKSTLLRSLVSGELPNGSSYGMFRPDLFGRSVGYVPQKGGLLPWYTVRKNFAVFGGCGSASTLVNSLGISHIIDSYPDQLSGGEYQRAMLAVALSTKPDILLVDEPLTGVDMEMRYRVLHVLQRYLDDSAKSLILVSHDPDILLYLCNEVIFFGGQEQPPPLSLFGKPRVTNVGDMFREPACNAVRTAGRPAREYYDHKRAELVSRVIRGEQKCASRT